MGNNRIITKMIDYIEEHLDEELTLNKIAEKAGYSKFHLNRLFSETVGCTIYRYIQARRLTEAAEKLAYTEKPIVEIAYEANYHSQQSFTLAFRQLYVCTPQAYRITGIHIPKQNRFTTSNLAVLYKCMMKYEVAA